jgi:hypothetical protein
MFGLLPCKLKERHVNAYQELPWQYKTEDDGFLNCIVTGDESWVQYYQPEMKRVSKEWCHSSLRKPIQLHAQASVGKAMLMLYWDYKGPLVEHYMFQGTRVTSAIVRCSVLVSYCCMKAPGHTMPVWELRWSQAFISNVFLAILFWLHPL